MRASICISAAGLAASLAVLVAACSGPAQPATVPTATPQTTASASASASVSAAPSASASAGPGKKDVVASWTDDEAIKGLAADCHWDPGGCLKSMGAMALQSMNELSFLPPGATPDSEYERKLPPASCRTYQALACATVPQQSCAWDECAQSDNDCVPECDKGCGTCADKCVAGCETCKSACTDDACRLTCAKSCAACHQTCLKDLDHCATSHCAEVQEACFKTRDEEWGKSTCPKVCPKVHDCIERCPHPPDDIIDAKLYASPCANSCLKKLGKGCPAKFDNLCKGHQNATIAFDAYHAAHHPEEK
jgi:hypothetical protein